MKRKQSGASPQGKLARTGKLAYVKEIAQFTTKATVELAASTIPLIGGTIATAIATMETARINRRLEAFIQEVHELYSRLDVDKLDRGYVQSDAFGDVVMAAIDAGRRSSSLNKRRVVAASLVGAITIDRPSGLDAEALLDTLGGLSPDDLSVARLLYSAVDRTTFGIVGGAAPPNVPDVDFHIARLVAAGLFVGRGPMTDFAVQQTSYFPTETFERLIRLMSAGGVDEFG